MDAHRPPYQTKRPLEARVAMLQRDADAPRWVIGGGLEGWGGETIKPRLTLAIFLTLDQEERLSRLKIRERQRFGDRIAPEGDMYQTHLAFLEWAASYESNRLDLTTRARHENWIATLSCSVVRLSGMLSTANQVKIVLGQQDTH